MPDPKVAEQRVLPSIIAAIQHRAATAVGVNEGARADTVAAMLENNHRRAPGYWIQLSLAIGIATLGLVLGSTAVVIGAMLVSPLMGPILELGMGFAVGSSFLVLRASLRVVLSVVVVVAGAAALTLALPFHEITSEIAARTAPTALDLLVAAFCALTAAYTTVRSTSDTTSAAAGTAIGIALVPPLCVAGFGLGTGSSTVAGGAALLFTANFSAILVLAVLSFLVLGYNQVDAWTIEQTFIGPDTTRTGRIAAQVQAGLHRAFGSTYGMAMRVIIPTVFLAAVYVPLRRALNEVTWEVRARDAVRRVLAANAPHAVQTSVSIERHTVTLHLVLVGTNDVAASIERRVTSAIAAGTGVIPDVSITAVPDARTLAAATTARDASTRSAAGVDIATIRQRVSEAILVEWPVAAAGPVAGWELVVPAASMPAIVIHHLGPPLGSAGEAMLADRWSSRVGARVQIRDAPLAPNVVSARLGRERDWWSAVGPLLEWVGAADRAQACVAAPIAPSRKVTLDQQRVLAELRASQPAKLNRLMLVDSSGWSFRAAIGQCAKIDSTPPDLNRTRPP